MANQEPITCQQCKSSKHFHVFFEGDELRVQCPVCKHTFGAVPIPDSSKPPAPPAVRLHYTSPQGQSQGFQQTKAPPSEIEEYTLPFGKYKGETLAALDMDDPDYLCWLSEQDWVSGKLRRALTEMGY